EDVGGGRYHCVGGVPDQPQDLGELADHGGKSDDRQFLDWKQRVQSLSRHGAAADTDEIDGAAEALAQHLHQAGAEPVAGFFRRDQKDPPPDAACRRHRAHAATPVMKSEALSAAAIIACGSATMVFPAITAMPASFAIAAPSTVRGPM